MSANDRILPPHPVLRHRLDRAWSQAELARRAGISRAAVSAIEGRRLSPSVDAALALAAVLECSVEELFGRPPAGAAPAHEWAWVPRSDTARYWEAQIGNRRLFYPVEAAAMNPFPHDGVWSGGVFRESEPFAPEKTLAIATCDPAAGLLAAEYARVSGFRLLVFPRGGGAALELLRQRLVPLAALHRSTPEAPDRNDTTVRERLGEGYELLRAVDWEEGVALPPGNPSRDASAIARQTASWAAREPGSGARECLDELLGGRSFAGREVRGHGAVAEAVRSGWVGAGICVRFAAEDAGLNFLPIRRESLDICYPQRLRPDPRIQALIQLLRSRGYRRLLSELPGYDARLTGELRALS